MRQAITWTNDDSVHGHTYTSPCLNVSSPLNNVIVGVGDTRSIDKSTGLLTFGPIPVDLAAANKTLFITSAPSLETPNERTWPPGPSISLRPGVICIRNSKIPWGIDTVANASVFSWWRHQMVTFFALLALLCGEFTGHWWYPLTKASDAELWCFLWSAPWINGWLNNREAGDLRRHSAHYDVIVMAETISYMAYRFKTDFHMMHWPLVIGKCRLRSPFTCWITPKYVISC